MTTPADESMDWMKALEKRVSAVTTEVAELRKKNRSLVAKVNRLERESREKSEAASDAWVAQKTELKERVEGLAGKLEGLLGE